MLRSSPPIDERSPGWRLELSQTLVRKMSTHATLSAAECERLLDLPAQPRRLGARATIVEEGEVPLHACALIRGAAFRYKTLADGSRQILSFHLPGDVIDLNSTVLEVADHGIATLTDVVVAQMSHAEVAASMREFPGLARAFWRETLVDASIFREWLLNIGRRDAYARIAHLLCETGVRCLAAGLGGTTQFPFPVTQTDLGDATALTPVHVNRTLQRLRNDGLVEVKSGEVRIREWQRLKASSGFDHAYLHLPAALAA